MHRKRIETKIGIMKTMLLLFGNCKVTRLLLKHVFKQDGHYVGDEGWERIEDILKGG